LTSREESLTITGLMRKFGLEEVLEEGFTLSMEECVLLIGHDFQGDCA
jgi:hypothetical protein